MAPVEISFDLLILARKEPFVTDNAPSFRRIAAESLYEQVIDAFCEALIDGRLTPGQRLVERDMAEQMGLSRGPIREALSILERQGLVNRHPRKGSYVADLTQEDIADVYVLQRMFETFALRLAIERSTVTDETLAWLEGLVSEIADCARRNDLAELIERDLDFHQVICELSGSQRLAELYASTRSQRRMLFTMSQAALDTLEDLSSDHAKIIEGLRTARDSRDPSPAVVALERHVAKSVRELTEKLADRFPHAPRAERNPDPLQRESLRQGFHIVERGGDRG